MFTRSPAYVEDAAVVIVESGIDSGVDVDHGLQGVGQLEH
jgi:hypothetical protein